MNWTRPSTTPARLLSHATLALGLWIAPTLSALGAERTSRPAHPCPPGWQHESAPHMAPGTMSPGPAQSHAPGADAAMPQTDTLPQEDEQPAPPREDFSEPQTSRASLSPGAETPQLGRMDFANRMNIFDNMTALPQTKVWLGYQYASGIQTGTTLLRGAVLPPGFTASNFTGEQRQSLYRVGGEFKICEHASVAVQGQYYTNENSASAFHDEWSQPQILAKWAFAHDYDTIWSATFGVQPETGVDPGGFEEHTTRLYPGMLYYQALNGDWFTQGGFQFGIPTDEDDGVETFDWSVSVGYWLYRDPCWCCECCSSGWISGIIPQVGILGKHVIGDNTIVNPFGFGSLFVANESSDVLDLTAGALIIVDRSIQIGLGYSIPISDNEVREDEFITYISYVF